MNSWFIGFHNSVYFWLSKRKKKNYKFCLASVNKKLRKLSHWSFSFGDSAHLTNFLLFCNLTNVWFSYLAETPLACREKVGELLEFMLLIEGEDEPRFWLLSQIFLYVMNWHLEPRLTWSIMEWQPFFLHLLFTPNVMSNNNGNWRMQNFGILWSAKSCEYNLDQCIFLVCFMLVMLLWSHSMILHR